MDFYLPPAIATPIMKSFHWLPLPSGLFILCGPSPAAESHHADLERESLKQGVLGRVNVLRELDPRAFTNRVMVTSNVAARDATTPDHTIDASGKSFGPSSTRPRR